MQFNTFYIFAQGGKQTKFNTLPIWQIEHKSNDKITLLNKSMYSLAIFFIHLTP